MRDVNFECDQITTLLDVELDLVSGGCQCVCSTGHGHGEVSSEAVCRKKCEKRGENFGSCYSELSSSSFKCSSMGSAAKPVS
jgi:hypothetical protein